MGVIFLYTNIVFDLFGESKQKSILNWYEV